MNAPGRRGRPDPAREAALVAVLAVMERDAYANLVLPAIIDDFRLTGRDAGFATELVYGALRGQGLYDTVLAQCSSRPLERLDLPVLAALRLGTHQALAMRVPSHAAVATTVDLVRSRAGSAAGFANAVMRRVVAQDQAAWVAQVAPDADADPIGHLAVAHSHPRWIVTAFADALGDLDEVAACLAADNAAPLVTLVARPGRAEVADLVAAGAEPGRFSPVAAVLPGGDVRALPGVRTGDVGIQDEGSQLVTIAAATAPVDGADAAWLDLCAGPGGKAALLDAIGRTRGARLLAAEPLPHRAALVRAAIGSEAAVVIADGRDGPWPSGRFDRVVADVPCTGLGALRRRPEARWRRTESDVARLGPLQRDLLVAALEAARPGGLVAYLTCSPHQAETRAVVEDVLRAGPAAEFIDARPFLPGVSDLGDGPDVQLWPHRHGTDAMYCALLRRV